MTSLIFPDLNVWLSLSIETHVHHQTSWAWYRSLRGEELAFCRLTQLGLLRLLCTTAIAKEQTLTQQQAWSVYDHWINSGGAAYLEEPFGIDTELRFYASSATPAPRQLTDSYLIAFAAAASLPLVTLDKALSQRYARSILLS